MICHSFDDIMRMEKRFRTCFVNCLSGVKSPVLLGSQDDNGCTNLAIMSSVFHVGANPPLLGTIIRPHSVPRHSLENIIETGVYTLNHVTVDFFEDAHQTAARYDKDMSEFDAVGLDPIYRNDFPAPFVKQSPLSLGMSLQERQTLSINQTELIIGKIEWVYARPDLIETDGYISFESLGGVGVVGLDSYHMLQALSRLPYAKPKVVH